MLKTIENIYESVFVLYVKYSDNVIRIFTFYAKNCNLETLILCSCVKSCKYVYNNFNINDNRLSFTNLMNSIRFTSLETTIDIFEVRN